MSCVSRVHSSIDQYFSVFSRPIFLVFGLNSPWSDSSKNNTTINTRPSLLSRRLPKHALTNDKRLEQLLHHLQPARQSPVTRSAQLASRKNTTHACTDGNSSADCCCRIFLPHWIWPSWRLQCRLLLRILVWYLYIEDVKNIYIYIYWCRCNWLIHSELHRQIRPTKLDRHRIHPDINGLHPDIRPDRRYLWATRGIAAVHGVDAGGQHAGCSRAVVGDVASRACSTGHEFGGNHEYYHDCAFG